MKVKVSVAPSFPILCDPLDCNLPGSPTMGFSRQDYWSGLPFSFPDKSLYICAKLWNIYNTMSEP